MRLVHAGLSFVRQQFASPTRRVWLDAPGVRVARGFAGIQNEPRL